MVIDTNGQIEKDYMVTLDARSRTCSTTKGAS